MRSMCCRSEIHVKRIFQLGINFDLTTFVWDPAFVIFGLQSLGWDIGLGQLESRSKAFGDPLEHFLEILDMESTSLKA